MPHTINPPASRLGCMPLCFLCVLVLIGAFAHAQTGQKQSPNPAPAVNDKQSADSIAKAREDTPESIYYVEEIAKQGQVEAVPMLEDKFGRTKDALGKAHIASALVRLGDKKDIYWDFLARQATVAIESGIPDIFAYDSQGKLIPGPSPEFTSWSQAHNLSPAAAQEQVISFLGAVMSLAVTKDWRAVPLLRQALSARNYMIQSAAAEGLAAIQDKESIPLIVDAVKKAPAEAGAVIARSLVYFDDPEAQAAVDKYVPKDSAKALREDRAARRTKTPWD